MYHLISSHKHVLKKERRNGRKEAPTRKSGRRSSFVFHLSNKCNKTWKFMAPWLWGGWRERQLHCMHIATPSSSFHPLVFKGQLGNLLRPPTLSNTTQKHDLNTATSSHSQAALPKRIRMTLDLLWLNWSSLALTCATVHSQIKLQNI